MIRDEKKILGEYERELASAREAAELARQGVAPSTTQPRMTASSPRATRHG